MWIAEEADRYIRRLGPVDRRLVDERLAQLRGAPHQAAIPLQGWDGIWSSRIGHLRLFCLVADDVRVLAVGRLDDSRWQGRG